MIKDKITCLILSCDKFSDLWEGHLNMYNKNWLNRDFDTYIITDKDTDKSFPGVTILSAGGDVEWSDRLAFALKYVKTELVFLTLDDYFLIEPVNNENIEELADLMLKDGYDYIRFFKKPKAATLAAVIGYEGIYHVDNNVEYSVNLYSCLWKKDFLAFTVKESMNAWEFEISLSKQAIEYGAECLVSYKKDFVILDVVRKGHILKDANRYFKKHPGIYECNRPLQSWQSASKLWVKTMAARYTPHFLYSFARKVYVMFGGTSFAK